MARCFCTSGPAGKIASEIASSSDYLDTPTFQPPRVAAVLPCSPPFGAALHVGFRPPAAYTHRPWTSSPEAVRQALEQVAPTAASML